MKVLVICEDEDNIRPRLILARAAAIQGGEGLLVDRSKSCPTYEEGVMDYCNN